MPATKLFSCFDLSSFFNNPKIPVFKIRGIPYLTLKAKMVTTWIACSLGIASFLALLLFLFFLVHIVVTEFLQTNKGVLFKKVVGFGKEDFRPRKFSLREIYIFSEEFSNKIGNGSTNAVFKGTLPDGTEVAIKRSNSQSIYSLYAQARSGFQIELLSRIRHQNLVNLVGYSDESGLQFLLFQYASNGTLYENLHGSDEHLTWKQRKKVLGGIAYGLAYLHSCEPPIIHGDLCSQNIFLTEDHAAKIGGIGKEIVARISEPAPAETENKRSFTREEVEENGKYTPAQDVYAFGVLIIELVSGKAMSSADHTSTLYQWAKNAPMSQEKMMELVDPSLNDALIPEITATKKIVQHCLIGENRPTMAVIIDMISKELKMTTEAAAPLTIPVTLKGLLDLL